MYKTSTDYERLADLVEAMGWPGRIVDTIGGTYHFFDYGKSDPERDDVCYFGGLDEFCWTANSREEFIEKCKKENVKFIDPASQQEERVKALEAVCERFLWLYGEENTTARDEGLRIDGFHAGEHMDIILDMAVKALAGAKEKETE